jgi:peptidoglycan hydrolase-like protein with peptidoglycan-binding domain
MKIGKWIFYLFVALLAFQASAATTCSFTRDLEEGSIGEDVRCLQKYLNSSGYIIAGSGVGSPGNETNLFRTLTKESISKWQIANGLPGTGYFGPASRAKYASLVKSVVDSGGSQVNSTGTSSASYLINTLSAQVLELEETIDRGSGRWFYGSRSLLRQKKRSLKSNGQLI